MKLDHICRHHFISSFISRESIVIDLGINQGEFSKKIINRYGCTVYGVEPVPELFNSFRMNKLHPYNIAIAERSGETTLHINLRSCASIRSQLFDLGGKDTIVKCLSLSDFIQACLPKDSFIDLIKMDIEGAEFVALNDLKKEHLKRIGMITVEFHDFLDGSLTQNVEEIIVNFKKNGFTIIKWSQNNTDVLFINHDIHKISMNDRFSLTVKKYYQGGLRLIRRNPST